MTTVLLLALAASAAAQEPSPAPDDARVRLAWSRLTDSEQLDCLARFEAEVPYLDTFQLRLIRFARALEERDLGYLPQDAPAPWYDPAVHAPRQPIARRPLEPDAPAARKALERMAKRQPARSLRSAWRYDWGVREVVRGAPLEDPPRTFENALAGYAPGHDLAIALVERALDDGSQQKALAAFAHAYTDRAGAVFPGITLYDAWSSGAEIEMPDVDVLGIVHDLLGEWERWVAPVPDRQHDELYERVGELFAPAQRHRGLRTALAWCFLEASPPLSGSYPTCIERFHALWETHSSTPAEVARVLPKPDQWGEFLTELSTRVARDPKLAAAAQNRRATLEADRAAVRAFLVRILKESGAFERTSKPAPAPTPPPAPPKDG